MTLRRGGKKGLAAAKAKLQSTLGDSGTGSETNPPPVTGSMFIGREGVDLQPMQLRGASISPEDGRRFLLMVAAAVGLPETYFGDASVGTRATAKSMDRPTELAMRDRQTMWIDVLMNIFQFVLLQAVKASGGPLRKIAKVKKTNDGDVVEEKIVWKKGVNPHLDVDFPPLLERDVQAAVQAIVTAATMNGQMLVIFDEPTVARLLLTALAQDDVDEIMAELYPDEAVGSVTDSTEALKSVARRIAEVHHAND